MEEIQPDADYENGDTLIDDRITITLADIIPENFNSAEAHWDMVCRLKD